MEALAAYAGLFAASFLAATVFPFQSEVVLFGLLVADRYSWGMLLAVASIGNTLGSVVNWLLGRGIDRLHDRRWFPIRRETFERAQAWYRRWGSWSLLLAWAPFIGDPLTVVAGALRVNLATFVVLVGLGKTARYLAVVAAGQGWSG